MKTARASGLVAAAIVALSIGCAAPQKEARSTTILSATVSPTADGAPAAPSASAGASEDATNSFEAPPTACSAEAPIKNAKACLPPTAFGKKLCGGIYPEVALGMFAKGTPWTRLWLAGDVEAWNASGGRTHRAKLAFDEEIIVLSRRAPGGSGGIVMTGAMASYDVLRWDGTCVSVLEGELTTRRPPAPKPATVPWSRLEETTRRALLASPKVKTSHTSFEKVCGSVASPAEKKACEKADKAFAKAVAEFVRGAAALPMPARHP